MDEDEILKRVLKKHKKPKTKEYSRTMFFGWIALIGFAFSFIMLFSITMTGRVIQQDTPENSYGFLLIIAFFLILSLILFLRARKH